MEDLAAVAYTTTSGITGHWKSYTDEPGFSTGTWAATVYGQTCRSPAGSISQSCRFC